MDIHKPKAARNLREFLIEIGTIICGILIALGLEQTVELVHWSHQVEEARRAIRTEIAHDLGAVHFRFAQSECVERRVRDLKRWEEGTRGGARVKLDAELSGPRTFAYYTDTWEVAQAGQVAAHFPVEELTRYAQLYGQLRAMQGFQQAERDAWSQLLDFSGAEQLDPHDIMRLSGLWRRLARWNKSLADNRSLLDERAAALGIKAEKLDMGSNAFETLRKPLFA